ncbi:MAG: hypothetical protein CVU39_28510 [Chloroflexi bacterium HGW-Chloroflexi-10]|nr:MAG: hypothetical protein CVU39_28510 [Chloroflexi bacterium HGW-Chloroflexi-10]
MSLSRRKFTGNRQAERSRSRWSKPAFQAKKGRLDCAQRALMTMFSPAEPVWTTDLTRIFFCIIFALVTILQAGCGPVRTNLPLTPILTPLPSASASPPTLTQMVPANTPTVHLTSFPAINDFATYLEGLAAADQFSGAVLVAENGEILLEKAYGLAKRTSLTPNQVDTQFNLGSMNKMFTAVAIMQLMEQGKLSLDDTILKHLPDYPNAAVAEAVTIHHLLTHTSGLGDVFTEEFVADPHRYRTNAEFLPLFMDEPLHFKPGDRFSYSNAGFVVLGLIIEKASGQSYDDAIQQNIFDPAGMADTGSFEIDANTPGLALGYTTRDIRGNESSILGENTPLIPIRGFAAGGGYSTVEDLFLFRNALLNFKLLSPQATELLLTGKVAMWENSNYAYGFMDQIVGGQRAVGHTGGAPGICSFLHMYPESGYTVTVLSNSDNGCFLILDYLKINPFSSQVLSGTPALTSEPPKNNVSQYAFPAVFDPSQSYLFYLHGKIIEDQGIPAISPKYGEYEYAAILETLSSKGFVVISEKRPKNTDGMKYAERVVAQVMKLLKAGVPARNITVAGASKGAGITLLVSSLLRNQEGNFVVMGTCDPDTIKEWKQNKSFLNGNVLAIYDSVDEYAGSCQELFEMSEGHGIARHKEIVLQVGTGHGILYHPLDEWILPTIEWARKGQTP